MRIGSGQSNSKYKLCHQASSYQNQNNQLKKLHEQRMRRQQQQRQTSEMESQSVQSSYFQKQMKNQNKQNQKINNKYPQNMLLNSLLSDPRSIKQKPCAISLSSLFQDDPKTFSTGISKNIKSVLISSYGFVMDVLGTIAQSGIPFAIVNDSQQMGQGKVERNYQGYKNTVLISPPRTNKGYGVFHSKVWLIKFSSFLRVVIGTGNQHAQDWVVWLNSYWYQDFPLKGMKISDYFTQEEKPIQKQKKQTKSKNIFQCKNAISLDDEDSDVIIQDRKKGQKKGQKKEQKKQDSKPFNYDEDFKQTLSMVVKKMLPASYNLQKQLGINFQNYEISNIKVILIPSIPGRHYLKDGEMKKFGMAKVKAVMKQLGPQIKKGSLSYNTSSLGIVQQNFSRQLFFSFLPHAQSFSPSNLKVIYPSYKYITQQTCGQASVLYLKKQNYYKSDLKKDVFYHYQPSQKNPIKGAIPHLKTIVVQNTNPTTQNQRTTCIFYMGSHNMTKAAWGTYQKNDTQISFSNSQLGLLFLDMDKEKLMNWLPYRYPPRKYNDYQKPFLREL